MNWPKILLAVFYEMSFKSGQLAEEVTRPNYLYLQKLRIQYPFYQDLKFENCTRSNFFQPLSVACCTSNSYYVLVNYK